MKETSAKKTHGARLSAGMTVEAAIVLPLFLFFFINLGSAMEMIRLHGNLQLALWDTGNKMCVYGYAAADRQAGGSQGEQPDAWNELKDIALTYTYVKQQVVKYVGKVYLEEAPLDNGISGLQFWESNILANGSAVSGEVVDIVMTYQVSPWVKMPLVASFRMSNRYYGRVWTGYGLGGGGTGNQPDKDLVYITENRSVYHEDVGCSHLKLRIHEISKENLKTARNAQGGKYYMCSKCKYRPYQGVLFICDDGDYYHYSRDCSGLKRTISSIPRQQALRDGLRPCSRCGIK